MSTRDSTVTLTAELRDAVSKPAGDAQRAVEMTAAAVEKASKRQAKATDEASKESQAAWDKATKKASGMDGIFRKVGTGNAFDGIKKGIDGAAKKVDAAVSGMSDKAKTSLKLGFAAAGAAGGAALAVGMSGAMAAQAGSGKIAAQLGLSPTDAKKAGSAAGALYADAYGGSLDEVNGAVSAVMSSIKGMRTASAGDLQAMTANVMDLSNAFELDVGRTAQVAGQMITSGLAEDGAHAADLLTISLQKVGPTLADDLMDAVDEYGPFMANLGISGEKGMGMLAAAAGKGMYGIDKTGDALKEFGIRATDMSTASAVGYDLIGASQSDMTARLLAGGDTASTAFQDIISGVQGIEDPVAKSQAALALFGTPLEDLSVTEIPKFLDSLSSAKSGLGDVAGATDDMGRKLNDNASTRIAGFMNSMKTNVVNFIGDKVLPIISEVTGGAQAFGTAFSDAGTDVTSGGLAGIMERIGLALGGVWGILSGGDWNGKLRGAFGWEEDHPLVAFLFNFRDAVMGAFEYVQSDVIPALRDFAGWLSENRNVIVVLAAAVGGYALAMGALSIISTVRGWIAAATTAQWGLNAAMAANPIGIVVGIIAALIVAVVLAYNNIGWFKDGVDAAWAGIQSAVSTVVTWFQTTAWPVIKGILDFIGGAFSWLWSNIISPIFGGFIPSAIGAAWLVIRGIFQVIVSFLQVTLGPVFTWLYENIIKPAWDGISSLIGGVWNDNIKPVFDALGGFIEDVLPKAFQIGVSAIESAWNGLKSIARAPVEFVVNKVINDGLIGAFNTVAGWLPGVDKLPRVELPAGFKKGGYTGDIGVNEAAGVVHGKEYVFDADTTRKGGGARGMAAIANMISGGGGGGGGFFNSPFIQQAKATGKAFFTAGAGPAWQIPSAAAAWNGMSGLSVQAGQGRAQGYTGQGPLAGGILAWAGGNTATFNTQGMAPGLSPTMKRATAIHELGHLLGLPHTSAPSIMQPVIGAHMNPTGYDAANMQRLYPGGTGKPGSMPSGEDGGGFDPMGMLGGMVDDVLGKFDGVFSDGGIMADIALGIGRKVIDTVLDNFDLFDEGGMLGHGAAGINLSGKPEAVLTGPETENYKQLARTGGRGTTVTIEAGAFQITIQADDAGKVDTDDLREQIEEIFDDLGRRGY